MSAEPIAVFRAPRAWSTLQAAVLLGTALLFGFLALREGLPPLDWSRRAAGIELQRALLLAVAAFSLLAGAGFAWHAASTRPVLVVDAAGLEVWAQPWASPCRIAWAEVGGVEVVGDPRSTGALVGIQVVDLEQHLVGLPLPVAWALRLNHGSGRPTYTIAGGSLGAPAGAVADLLRRELAARRPA